MLNKTHSIQIFIQFLLLLIHPIRLYLEVSNTNVPCLFLRASSYIINIIYSYYFFDSQQYVILVSLGVSNEVGSAIIKWLYTDRADIKNDEKFIIELVKAANRYRLDALKNRYIHNFLLYFIYLFLRKSVKISSNCHFIIIDVKNC